MRQPLSVLRMLNFQHRLWRLMKLMAETLALWATRKSSIKMESPTFIWLNG